MTILPLGGGAALTLTADDLSPLGLAPERLTKKAALILLRAICRREGVPLPDSMTVELFTSRAEVLLLARSAPRPHRLRRRTPPAT